MARGDDLTGDHKPGRASATGYESAGQQTRSGEKRASVFRKGDEKSRRQYNQPKDNVKSLPQKISRRQS